MDENGLKELAPGFYFSKLRGMVDEKRYRHSLGTANLAVFLAGRYGLDEKKAAAAGLLHDCAKGFSKRRIAAVMKKCGMKLSAETLKIYPLWHAPAGVCAAKFFFNIKDREVLNAVLFHAAGNVCMGNIAKVVYIADFAEPARGYAASKKIGREIKIGTHTLDRLLFFTLREKLSYLIKEGRAIHKDAVDLWNFLGGKL